ncbi:ribosome assembly factor mrt4-like [Schistocerca gregaria]|uniref:ribosome assembly factor mrt4-like n=1 Tax=Schistocerca gregaria TaxID=7010 RepID=UPI00211F0D38|nr:ribosome assembly factor mrt4-like [Schistocerca gregaria]
MPQKRRNNDDVRVVLKKIPKRTKEDKVELVQRIRQAIPNFDYVYVLGFQNGANALIKAARKRWKDEGNNRSFFGKQKILALALGKSEEDELLPELHKLTASLGGDSCLLLSTSPKHVLLEQFDSLVQTTFARPGEIATEDVKLDEGLQLNFSNPVYILLHKMGWPVKKEQGVVQLTQNFDVCSRGDVLTPEKCKALKLLGKKMSEFRIFIKGYWHANKFYDESRGLRNDK